MSTPSHLPTQEEWLEASLSDIHRRIDHLDSNVKRIVKVLAMMTEMLGPQEETK